MKRLFIFYFLLASFSSLASSDFDNWREALIVAGTNQLEKQFLINAENDRRGESYKNQYIISLDDLVETVNYMEERGSTSHKILSSTQLQTLDSKIVSFHDVYSKSKEVGFYVLIINDWKLNLAKKLPLNFAINTLNDLRTYAQQQEQQEVDRMLAELQTVPGEILRRLTDKGYAKLTYVYLYAQISTYDIDGSVTVSIDNPKVKRRRFVSHVLDANQLAKQQTQFRPTVWDISTLLERNHLTHYSRLEANIDKFTDSYASSLTFANRVEEAEALGIAEGPGRQLFVNLPLEKKLDSSEKIKFVELCKHLNSETNNKEFAFYHPGIESRFQDGSTMSQETLNYCYSNNLLTKNFFENHFYPNFSSDYGIIFSYVDLRKDIPPNYNEFSVDWTSHPVDAINSVADLEFHLNEIEGTVEAARQDTDPDTKLSDATYNLFTEYIRDCRVNAMRYATELRLSTRQTIQTVYLMLGYYEKYDYSMADLKKRHELQTSDTYFFDNIKSFEAEGQAEAIVMHNTYDQYVARYNTDKTYFLGQEYDGMMGVINMAFYGQQIVKQVAGLRQSFKNAKRLRAKRLRTKDVLDKTSESIKSKVESIISKNSSKQEKLKSFESTVRNEPEEHGIILKDDGNIIAYKKGEYNKVSFSEYVGQTTNATLSHNHPSDGTFSEWDFFAAHDLKLSEIRAVGPTKKYVMKRPQGGWPSSVQISETSLNARNAWKEKYASEYMVTTLARKKILEQIYWDMARPDIMQKFGIEIIIE